MFTKIWQGFEKGNFAPVYLLVGEESYFVDETIKRLKAALSKEEETEVMTFDLNEQPIDYVIDEADTIPFFTERKLIIAKNTSFLKATEKGKEKIEHDLKRLENWLANPSDTTVTIFIAPYEKLDERKKVTKLMKEKSVLLLAETPQNNDLNAWIRSEVAKNGKAITEAAIQKLIEMVGPNMLQHQMEIEKMALYLGGEPEISVELVEDLVAKTLEQDAFKMLNAYLNNKQEEALIIYHDLLRQKEEPIKLVGLLANNIRTMIHVYYLQKKGYHQQQIAKQLKVHPYRVQMVINQRNRPTDQRLLQALYTLANVDLQLKTTGGNRERHLELFLMKQL
ncbi:DNA polymerase III subunit delta [Solibacillus sp. R5-41]|uniref:DNA polymerase III subunit delta n=1 Tax=Solibacillus sp. R5-41 TaxID=2048654 RepID=UPI000C124B21|nr:DNA polymerase III subunit delta [Solibacillus sp. R5-41]ATP41205.1 DNA polymerase III subunit delta [Solibacillus sp. R5-41]